MFMANASTQGWVYYTVYPPFFNGLSRILSQQINVYEENLVPGIKNWRPPEHDQELSRSKPSFFKKPDTPLDLARLNFAFAPSVSGKITCIFNKLMAEYGYYMVAPAFRSQSLGQEAHHQNIMDPAILHGVSKDTREIDPEDFELH
jgi:hypothetical protein